MRIRDWLRRRLERMGYGADFAERVSARLPAGLADEDFDNVLLVDRTDYESLEAVRLFLSALGRALMEEGEEGVKALGALLNELREKSTPLKIMVDWYRVVLKNDKGVLI